jgi:hypothetical protein
MLVYDMLSGEFLDEHASAPAEPEYRGPMRGAWLELRLLSVEEAEAERSGRR